MWAEFDKKYFLLPPAQREKAILDNKKEIIEGLNKHFQKVYFGRNRDGTVVDLQVHYSDIRRFVFFLTLFSRI